MSDLQTIELTEWEELTITARACLVSNLEDAHKEDKALGFTFPQITDGGKALGIYFKDGKRMIFFQFGEGHDGDQDEPLSPQMQDLVDNVILPLMTGERVKESESAKTALLDLAYSKDKCPRFEEFYKTYASNPFPGEISGSRRDH